MMISELISNPDSNRITTRLFPAGEAIQDGVVELGILPLVEAMNSVPDVHTIASCQGHRSRLLFLWGYVESEPYVLFRCDHGFAQWLAATIGHGKAGDRLNYVWTLKGYFYPSEFESMAWILSIEDSSLPHSWKRDKVSCDVDTLTQFIRQRYSIK